MPAAALKERLRMPLWLLVALLVLGPLASVGLLVNDRLQESAEAIDAAEQLQASFTRATRFEQLSLWLTVADVTERVNVGLASAGLEPETIDDLIAQSDVSPDRSMSSMLSVPREEVRERATELRDTEPDLRRGLEDLEALFGRVDTGEISAEEVGERLTAVRRLADAAAADSTREVLTTQSDLQSAFTGDMLALQAILRGHRALIAEIEIVSAQITGSLIIEKPPNAVEEVLRAYGVFEHEREVFRDVTGQTDVAGWDLFDDAESNRRYEELRQQVPAYLASGIDGETSDFDGFEYLILSFERMTVLFEDFIPGRVAATLDNLDTATADATENARDARRFAAIVFIASLSAAAILAQWLLRPLRKLWRRANDLTSGKRGLDPLGPVGPREVSVVAEAIDGVSSNLDIIGGQLDAISTGEFDALVLRRRLPGAVGRSLEDSMNKASMSSARMHEQARVDVLTGLPNRLEVLERLDELLEHGGEGTRVGAAFLDLDRFKMVNDGLGHDAGDGILVQLAERLSAAMGPGEFVGRIGGDEFLAVAESINGIEDVREMASLLLDAVEETFVVAGRELRLKASVGIAIGKVGQATSSSLLRDADVGLCEAKNSSERITVSSSALREERVRRREMSEAIEAAIGSEELHVHLQPIVDLATERTIAAEALLRWTRDGQSISPGEFIPIVESTSLINRVGRWVLHEAAAYATRVKRETGRAIPISVNISWNHIVFGNLIDDVWSALKTTKLPPSLLSLEFTESTPPPDIEVVAATLAELARMGVDVWLDDFGTGYTSITQLQDLHFDTIKLDRSFVAAAAKADDDITDALMGIMGALDIDVVAEGVETVVDRDRMIVAGARFGQGWLWSKAMKIDAFVDYVAAEAPDDLEQLSSPLTAPTIPSHAPMDAILEA